MVNNFKDEDFENKIKNEDISILQFSTNWCQPCKNLRPVMEKLSEEIIDAANTRGGAVKKREDVYKMAEANKAFAHFAW